MLYFWPAVVNYKQFEESLRPFASPSAKRTDNVVIMSIVSSARKLNGSIFFGTFHIYAFLITIFFQIVDCVFAFENLLFGGVLTTSRLFRSLSNSRFNGNICGDKKQTEFPFLQQC